MPEIRTTSSTGGQKGTKLARFDLIPTGPLTELAEHYGRGARKYANHQWRQGYEWSKSYAACLRHLTAFWAGFDYDVCSNDPDGCSFIDADGQVFMPDEPDTCFNHTGSHHLAAVAWHSFLLLEFKDTYPEHDDRYKPEPKTIPAGWKDLGYTTLDAAWSRRPVEYPNEIFEEIWKPEVERQSSAGTHDYDACVDISLADVSHDVLRLIFGGPVRTRFIAGVDGTEDLETPKLGGQLWLIDPEFECGYVGEYRRHFLDAWAPGIDAVGETL